MNFLRKERLWKIEKNKKIKEIMGKMEILISIDTIVNKRQFDR